MTGGSDILVGDMPVERGAQGGQVQVAVDAAELPFASIMPAAHQRGAMFPLCQFVTLRL